MADILKMNGDGKHPRLIQLLGEIEARCERGMTACCRSLAELHQWANENESLGGDPFQDVIIAAVRYCELDYHLSQMISIRLKELGDAAWLLTDMIHTADTARRAHRRLYDLRDFARGYRVELEWGAGDRHHGDTLRNGQPKRKRGRRKRYDETEDRRIFEAWESREHETYANLAKAKGGGWTKDKVEQAIDRHRKRVQRGQL